jgi:hypothetical protein
MSNPVYSQYGKQNPQEAFLSQLMADARRFKQTMQGNPREMVQNLVNQGKITQQDINRVFPVVNQIANMMAGK